MAVVNLKSSEKCRNTPTRAEKQSVQRMAKPAVDVVGGTTSKPNQEHLHQNEVFDDKPSDKDEKHTFSLSTKQSSKNKLLFKNQSARNTCNLNGEWGA